MQIRYKVHSASEQPFQLEVDIGGEMVTATVQGLVVELVSEDLTMSRTIRVKPQNVAAARDLYVEGATIITTDTAEA